MVASPGHHKAAPRIGWRSAVAARGASLISRHRSARRTGHPPVDHFRHVDRLDRGRGRRVRMSGREIPQFAEGKRSDKGPRCSPALWRSRPTSISELMDGGVRIGQFNIERIVRSFLPEAIPKTFAELKIPLRVTDDRLLRP